MDVTIRPMREADLTVADQIFRAAFGTFLGMPDPTQFMGDAGFVRTRFKADPAAAFTAELEGEVVGSNFATNWGSVGFFGPLTVRPDLWDRGIAHRLLDPVMEKFTGWGCRHRGLFTFAHSPKHIGLYQRYDFWPRFLTAIMGKEVKDGCAPTDERWRLSAVPQGERESVYRACREVTDALYEGLDATIEARSIAEQGLGDTVLLWDGTRLVAFAACHVGPNTEAGTGNCFIKFGAVRPGRNAVEDLGRLVDACEALAAAAGCKVLVAGANMGRLTQYRTMLSKGFRTTLVGVAMEQQAQPGYNRPDILIIDDLR
jgi:GNAT superfamily N-acetyltransferase